MGTGNWINTLVEQLTERERLDEPLRYTPGFPHASYRTYYKITGPGRESQEKKETPARAYLGYLAMRDECVFGTESWRMNVLLAMGGVITAVPLLWFTNAARRLRLATLGFLQYLAPTGHFLLAVVAYGEPFARTHLISFACIWTALLIYSLDIARHSRPHASPRAF